MLCISSVSKNLDATFLRSLLGPTTMVSSLARIAARSMYIVMSFLQRPTRFYCRSAHLRTETCSLQVCHARNESYHDRRWYCYLEKEGRRIIHCRRRFAGDCKHSTSLSVPPLTSPKETDKATIDVEAQDDGILAKIIVSPLRCSCRVFSAILRLLMG